MRVRNFRVTGYLPDWNHYEGPLRYDCLDAIQYAFAIPTEEGDLLPLPDPEYAHRMVWEAHAHGTEFWVSVGGWSWQDVPLEATFNHIADSPERIRRLIRSAADLCREYDLDGIDMDWEYPRIQRTEGCEALYVGLADVLHSMGKKISTAVYAGADARFDGKDWLGSPVREINYGINDKTVEAMDYINIMAYDGGDGPYHSGYDFSVRSARVWLEERHIPPEKLLLGVPFYARKGTSYRNIIAAEPDAANFDEYLINGKGMYYNGRHTMERKTVYAAQNMGGVMIWELTEDAESDEDSLLQLIHEVAEREKNTPGS